MAKQISRWYRVLATGIGFLLFGLLTLLFSLIIALTPSVSLTSRRARSRQEFASAALDFFRSFLVGIGVFRRITYRGVEHIPENSPCIFIANHPTLLDPVILLAKIGPADCIVKKKHLSYFAVVARWFDYMEDQPSPGLFESCVERIKENRNLLLFPERTRSPKGDLRSFSRVPAQVSMATGCPVVPVLIELNHHSFGKDQSWYEVPPDPIDMRVTFYKPFKPKPGERRFSEASRDWTEKFSEFYEEQLPVESLDR